MSLFVDLRHIKTSVANLSEMVDNISKAKARKQSIDSPFTYRPLGLGVRFSQSQEDIESLPSRLRSHMSLPNLGKCEPEKSRLDSKIVEIDNEASTDKLNGLIVASLNKRPFFDDSADTHPMDFLENVKYYISELNIPEEKQFPFIISCLGGLPLMWLRCFKSEFKTVENFYTAFEEEFWGPNRQKAVLYDMKLGKYDENDTRSMSEYFLCKVSNYKHLNPPASDLEIVYSLAAHFPSAVELELRLTPKPSLREAYGLLRRREGEGNDFLPNYLYEMCEAFQRGIRPESARRNDLSQDTQRTK
ncbi:uncharacterized protein LOC123690269 [Pieris rapae]|uniref:uncharacterized protein LOC123690269 n=1 Tax=Pieris rapae TaxID=64459 RepID=UPI001E27A486|nr:uncharacterized protein LOC123690269 [Pieris rapae]